ncbi:uncharacterized protein LOC115232673 isoform X2 [Argonauta hians]
MTKYNLGVLLLCLLSPIKIVGDLADEISAKKYNGEYLDELLKHSYDPKDKIFPKYHQANKNKLNILKLKGSESNGPSDWYNPIQLNNHRGENGWLRHTPSSIEQVARANSKERTLDLKNSNRDKTRDNYPGRTNKGKWKGKLNERYMNGFIHSVHVATVHKNSSITEKPKHKVQNGTYHNPSAAKHKTNDLSGYIPMHDIYFISIIIGCSLAGFVGIIVAAVCWYKLQSKKKKTIDYPTIGPSTEDPKCAIHFNPYNIYPTDISRSNDPSMPFNSHASNSFDIRDNKSNNRCYKSTERSSKSVGDRKLAQSAQMYHYQHQKQQMIALEKANNEMKYDESDDEIDVLEEGQYTVYECPGLAPTGEMEVKNPLFSDKTSASSEISPSKGRLINQSRSTVPSTMMTQ